MVVLVVLSSVFNHLVPNGLQILGLVLGIVGALILVIPD